MKKFKVFYLAMAFIFSGFLTSNVQAQISVGVGLSYGTEIEELGLNFRVGYDGITEAIDGVANLTFWLVDIDGFSFTTFNVDGHYNFLENEKVNVYALAGLNVARTKVDDINVPGFGTIGGGSDSEIGLNVGAGVDLGISETFGIFGELKYVIGDADQLVLTAGAKYAF